VFLRYLAGKRTGAEYDRRELILTWSSLKIEVPLWRFSIKENIHANT
jgi:hypothetical protein